MNSNDRNMFLAILLSMGILFGWDYFVAGPQRKAYQEARQAAAEAAAELALTGTAPAGATPTGDLAGIGAASTMSLEEALAASPGRVPIETPTLTGSINLAGARFDDLSLKGYRETLDPASPIIRLLIPSEIEHGHYVEQGWLIAVGADAQSTQDLVWTAPAGAKLTPTTPVTFSARLGDLALEKKVSVDEQFMFTVEQTVRNDGGAAATLTPYGLVIQRGLPAKLVNINILHEGPIAIVGKQLLQKGYKAFAKASPTLTGAGAGGWVGITQKEWLAAAIPPQAENFDATLKNVGTPAQPVFRANYALAPRGLAPGAALTLTAHVFGGAKDVDVLRSYQAGPEKGGVGIRDFDKAVDWGNFFFLTRPIFAMLDFFGDRVGNWGVAILLLTLVIKAGMFPLANKAFESMSKMKKLQPQLQELQKRYADDKLKLQQEMMALYQKEKLNPLAGCLPVLVQIPVFYALYKTLFVTIELRHQPFFGWIRDLSAPDPTSIFNLFGLLPFEPTAAPLIGAFLGVGVLPILMGASMWVQTKMNPPAPDPIQQQVFALMPLLFTFLFASFSAGLVLYWVWSTVLSVAQQWYIMRRNGVDVEWRRMIPFVGDKLIAAKPK